MFRAALGAVLLALPAVAFAGPWVHEPGKGYLKAGWAHYVSSDAFVSGMPTGLDYRADTFDAYGEVGLPGRFQVIASLPFVVAVNTASSGLHYVHRWTGDLRIEVDRQLTDTPRIAVGLEARIPTYRHPSSHTQAQGLEANVLPGVAQNFPQLGDNNVDLTPKLMLGVGFSKPNGWFSAELGPRIRLGPYASGIFGSVNAGLWLHKQIVAVNLYANANRSLFPPPGDLSREGAYTQLSVMLTGWEPEPDLAWMAWVAAVPWALQASRGIEFGSAVSWRF